MQKTLQTIKKQNIDIRYYVIRYILREDKILIDHIPFSANPADAFTKALEPLKRQHCVELMNLC